MAWLVPTLRQSKAGYRPKLCIVVVPYCFLLDHHVSSSMHMFGHCNGGIDICSLKGKDIDEKVIPNVLKDKDSLPSILFVSLEAINYLMEYFVGHMEDLSKEGLISKIFIDECHTLLSELNFRKNYTSLCKIAALNVPMMVFSGSFQKYFIRDFLKYMFGSKDTRMYNFHIDNDIFGSKLIRIEHRASASYIEDCCKHVVEYVGKHVESNVHVIVSTKEEGK